MEETEEFFAHPNRTISQINCPEGVCHENCPYKRLSRIELVRESHKDFGIKRMFPCKEQHKERNNYNSYPKDNLIFSGKMAQQHNVLWCIPVKSRKVFEDVETHECWQLQPWYLTMFHNPAKNYKFLSYDKLYEPFAVGSSELIVPRKKIHVTNVKESPVETIHTADMKSGSYNYRTFGLGHFWADVLPNVFFGKAKSS
jgi:hypothetical protein